MNFLKIFFAISIIVNFNHSFCSEEEKKKKEKTYNVYAKEIRDLQKNDTDIKIRLKIKNDFIKESLGRVDNMNLTQDIQDSFIKFKTSTLLGMLKNMYLIPLSESQAPKIHAMVESLAKKLGLSKPIIFLSGDTKLFNAMAASFGKNSAVVVIGYKLLKHVSKEEFEAVMAHELSHIKHNHTLKTLLISTALLIPYAFIYYMISKHINHENKFPVFLATFFSLSILEIMIMLKLSRIFEKQADLSALDALPNKESMVALIENLQKHNAEELDKYKNDHRFLLKEIEKIKEKNPTESQAMLDTAETALKTITEVFENKESTVWHSHPSNKERIEYIRAKILKDYIPSNVEVAV